jgi:hypothetical protein
MSGSGLKLYWRWKKKMLSKHIENRGHGLACQQWREEFPHFFIQLPISIWDKWSTSHFIMLQVTQLGIIYISLVFAVLPSLGSNPQGWRCVYDQPCSEHTQSHLIRLSHWWNLRLSSAFPDMVSQICLLKEAAGTSPLYFPIPENKTVVYVSKRWK